MKKYLPHIIIIACAIAFAIWIVMRKNDDQQTAQQENTTQSEEITETSDQPRKFTDNRNLYSITIPGYMKAADYYASDVQKLYPGHATFDNEGKAATSWLGG